MSDMHPTLERALEVYVDQMERTASLVESGDRIRWRQYACAALSGLAGLPDGSTDSDVKCAATYADEMLKQERERFEKVTR